MQTLTRMAALTAAVFAVALGLLAGGSPLAAQDWSLPCVGGMRVTAAELRQGDVIIVVWASWSPRSRGIEGRINALARKWNGRARVVAVNFQEEEAQVAGSAGQMGVPVCLDLDGAFSRRFDVSTLPGLLVLRNGEALVHERLPEDPDRRIAAVLDR